MKNILWLDKNKLTIQFECFKYLYYNNYYNFAVKPLEPKKHLFHHLFRVLLDNFFFRED